MTNRFAGFPIGRTKVVIGLTGLLLLGLGFVGIRRGLENRLAVENHSGQMIMLLMIGADGSQQAAMFNQIPDGDTVSAAFSYRGDSSFHVYGILGDGTKFSGDYGYLTSYPFPQLARFTIGRGGSVDLAQGDRLHGLR